LGILSILSEFFLFVFSVETSKIDVTSSNLLVTVISYRSPYAFGTLTVFMTVFPLLNSHDSSLDLDKSFKKFFKYTKLATSVSMSSTLTVNLPEETCSMVKLSVYKIGDLKSLLSNAIFEQVQKWEKEER
jgi:hypothetical protein